MRLIDADNLKSELTKWFPMASLDGIESRTLFAQIMQDIDNTPTARNPVAHFKTFGCIPETCMCTNCENIFLRAQTEIFDYCPKCGADMQKGGAE